MDPKERGIIIYLKECYSFDIENQTAARKASISAIIKRKNLNIYSVRHAAVHKMQSSDEDHFIEPAARRGAKSENNALIDHGEIKGIGWKSWTHDESIKKSADEIKARDL